MHLINSFRQFVLKALIISVIALSFIWDKKQKAYSFTTFNNTSHETSYNSVWEDIGRELTLNHNDNDAKVQKQIHNLLSDKAEFNKALRAATTYIYFIHQQTKALGLPSEIALIPFIESQFNPNDRSNVGATGLWQLMPSTAKGLGVNVKGNYDGRKNVIASTHAALMYFKDLGKMFHGNWYLAIAAYNCGEGNVLSATHRAGSTRFTDLKLPAETEAYVPRLLAVAAIIKNPTKYGVTLPSVNDQPYFAELEVSKPVNLNKLSQSTHIDVDTLKALNPDYVSGESRTHLLLIPANKLTTVRKEIPNSIPI